jgi:hypothetical protein
MYAFRMMYMRMRQMERASVQASTLNDNLTNLEKATILGRVPGMDDISVAISDNQWFGREAGIYAQIFIAALAAEDDEDPAKYQRILTDVDNQLRSS